MRKIYFLFLMCLMASIAGHSQLLLTDDFTGLTTATNLAGQSSWTKGGTGPDLTVQNTTPLTYSGYVGGGAEYAQMPTASSTTSRVYKGFTSTAPGTNTFYYSFLLNLSATTATGDYVFTLGDPATGTNYFARLFAKTSGAGFVIGLSKFSATGTYGSTVYALNTTYLIVVKYTFVTGSTNDETYVWVNPDISAEPSTASADVSITTGGDASNTSVGNFLWHNRSSNNPVGKFDGVRVAVGATSAAAWTNLAPASASCTAPTTSASNILFSNINTTSLTASWTNGNGSKRIVIANTSNSFTDPVDGTDPVANATYTSGEQVVYNGNGSTVNVTGLTAATTYYFRVYEYNCTGSNTKYFVTAGTGNPASQATIAACTAPATQASAVNFSSVLGNSMTINWTSGSGSNRVVIMNTSNSFTAPADGTSPSANTVYSGSGEQVVYNGSGTSVAVTGLSGNTTYWFRVYEYNCTGASTKYYTATATGNPASQATPIASSSTDYFRSAASADWNVASTWESSPDNVTWITSSLVPTSAANTITIRSGNTVTITTNITADQIVIENGAVLSNTANVLTINDGAGDDVTINGGGVFTLASATSPVFGSGTPTVNVNTSGILRLSRTGYTGNGSGVNSTNYVYQNASILEYTLTSTISASGVTYFPNVDANTIPIFRTTAVISGAGGGSNTVINGFFEPNANFTFGGAGTKTIRNGIGGTGNVSAGTGGKLIINGATAQLAGTGTITSAAGLDISASTFLTVNSNKAIIADLNLASGSNITLGSNNLIVTGNVVGGNSTTYIKTNGTGKLTINNIGTTPVVFPVGNSTYNPLTISNGDGLNWSVNVADAINNVQPPFNTNKAVNRTWDITPSGASTGATLTFQYDDSDPGQLGTSFNNSEDVQAWHYNGNWSPAGAAGTPTGTPGSVRTFTLTGWTDFSPFAIANVSGPLPVTFANIKASAKNNAVLVEWSNLTEANIISYTIERSADGRNFIAIAQKAPSKNDGNLANYQYVDGSPLPANGFYRIKSLEANGKVSYSSIVKINTHAAAAEFIVYPNPVRNELNLQLSSLPAGNYKIELYNANAQLISVQSFEHTGSSATENISVSKLIAGVYQVRLSGPVQLQRQFVKQ